jgi:hypothetical protein
MTELPPQDSQFFGSRFHIDLRLRIHPNTSPVRLDPITSPISPPSERLRFPALSHPSLIFAIIPTSSPVTQSPDHRPLLSTGRAGARPEEVEN